MDGSRSCSDTGPEETNMRTCGASAYDGRQYPLVAPKSDTFDQPMATSGVDPLNIGGSIRHTTHIADMQHLGLHQAETLIDARWTRTDNPRLKGCCSNH